MVAKFISIVINGIYKTTHPIRSKISQYHQHCLTFHVYDKVREVIAKVIVEGLFVWIALIPITGLLPVWYIPSLGLIPFLVFEWTEEIVRRIK
jgi:hypothetical protein